MDTNQLQLENEKLNARLEKAKEVFKQQAQDIKAKDEAYLKLRDEHDELQEELNTTKKALHTANEALSNFDSKCARYDEVIKSLNEKNDKMTKSSIHWEYLYHSLLDNQSESSIELDTLKDKVKALEEIVDHNKVELNSNSDEITHLTNTIKDMNTEVANLTIKYNIAVTDKDKLVKDKEDMSLEYKGLQDTYNNLAEEHLRDVRTLNDKIEALESELTDKTENLNKALNEIQTLTNRLNTESTKVEEVKTKTKEAVTSIKKKLQTLNDGLVDDFNIFG